MKTPNRTECPCCETTIVFVGNNNNSSNVLLAAHTEKYQYGDGRPSYHSWPTWECKTCGAIWLHENEEGAE